MPLETKTPAPGIQASATPAPGTPSSAAPATRRATSGTAPMPLDTKTPAPGILAVTSDATRTDERHEPDARYSSESITSLPSPPSVPVRPDGSRAASIHTTETPDPAPVAEGRAAPIPVADHRSSPVAIAERRPARARTASDGPLTRHRRDQIRDLAVIANDDDAKRVEKLAKKLRLELVTFARIADVPEYLPVVTVGETWSGTDARVVYAARSQISDDQLGDLLAGLVHDCVVTPPAPLTRPQSSAEARRSQLAFAGARKLAAATDLAAAEAIATDTIHDLLDTDRAYCWFVDPRTGALWSEARRRNGGDDRHAIAGIAGWVARTGRTASVPRASGDPRWLGPIDDPEGDPNSQLLLQPLVRSDERVHGILIAARRARRPGFTEIDAALFARFAALAAPLFEQIDVAAQAQQMLGEDTSTRPPLPAAPASPLQAMLRGTSPLARWLFLAIGLAVGLLLGLLL